MLLAARRSLPSRAARHDPEAPGALFVGLGLAGWIAGHHLARRGRRVVVAEEVATEGLPEEDYTITGLDTDFVALERTQGAAAARLAAQSLAAAAECLQALVRRERMACGLERLDLYRFAEPGAMGTALEAEAHAAQRAGLGDAVVVPRPPIEGAPALPCLRLPGHVMLHAGRFGAGLARAIVRDGGRLVPPLALSEAHGGPRPWVAGENGARLEADLVALASRPSPPEVHHRVALGVRRGRITRAIYTERLPEGRFVAHLHEGSGPHETLVATSAAPPEAIEAWMRHRFPVASDAVDVRRMRQPRADAAIAFASGYVDPAFFTATARGTALMRATAVALLLQDFAAP